MRTSTRTLSPQKNAEDNTIFVGDSIVSIAESENSKLVLMSYSNRASYSKKFSKIYTMVIIGGIAVFLSSIILALFISFKLYRSVILVMDTLEDPNRLKGRTKLLNEFFYISNTIADRTRANHTMNNELDEKIMALKKSQIAALQAQINPHFLFNTLQLINLNILKETKADTKATKLIALLSDLLHSSYDTENYIVPVKEEIANTANYLEIQKARYKTRLHVIYDISENCLDYQTIKLILQPFVENSILHGFKEKEDNWVIKLRCFLENDSIVYEISDNGCGIPADILKNLNSSIQQKAPGNRQGIGVNNVNQRISLVFGSQCDFKITSNPNTGTVVTIHHKALLSL